MAVMGGVVYFAHPPTPAAHRRAHTVQLDAFVAATHGAQSLLYVRGKCGPTFPVEKIRIVAAALDLLRRLVRGMLVQLLPQVVVDEALVIDLRGKVRIRMYQVRC